MCLKGVTLIDKNFQCIIKPAIALGCDPIPFRTWKSNLMSLLCYLDARALGKQQCWHFIMNTTIRVRNPVRVLTQCAICGVNFENEIRFLNHMMEKHGFRNPNVSKPDRNTRGY